MEVLNTTHANVHVPIGAMERGGKDISSCSVCHIVHDCNGMCMIHLPEHEHACNTDAVTSVLESSHHPHSTWSKYPPSER